MKALMSLVFMSFSILGFSQERGLLETPAQLDYPNIQLWSFLQTEIIDPEKEYSDLLWAAGYEIFYLSDGTYQLFLRSSNVRTKNTIRPPERIYEVISEGQPSQNAAGFISLPKNPESGWY